MSWAAVAIGGSALIGAGASIYGANKASQAQQDAGTQALDFQKQVFADQQKQQTLNRQNYDEQRGWAQPYIQAGTGAVGKLSSLYGLGGNGQSGDWSSFLRASPEYQFSLGEGTRALENSAAAKGGLLSGNFARGITEFGQGLASKQIGNYISNLQNIGTMGSGAIGSLTNQSTSLIGQGNQGAITQAGQIGGTIGGIGQAAASGYVGGANALTGSLGSGMQNYLLMNALTNKSSYTPTPVSGTNWGPTPSAPPSYLSSQNYWGAGV